MGMAEAMNIISWSGDLAYGCAIQAKEQFLAQGKSAAPNLLILKDLGKLDMAGLQILISLELWLEGSGGKLFLGSGPEATRVNALSTRVGHKQFTVKDATHA